MRSLDLIAVVLVVVGALNWGLVGVARFDLVAALLGSGTIASGLVYTLVGLAGLYLALQLKGMQRRWQQSQPVTSPA